MTFTTLVTIGLNGFWATIARANYLQRKAGQSLAARVQGKTTQFLGELIRQRSQDLISVVGRRG